MLILTRYEDQEIVIGEDEIIIKILRINNKQVSLGVKAPKGFSVHRREIYNKIKKEKETAIEVFDLDLFESDYKNGDLR